MKTFKTYINEIMWNEEDIKIFKDAKSNLIKAEKTHKKLMIDINKKLKILFSKREEITKQESGQGQRSDELQYIQSEITILRNLETESLNKINNINSIINIKK